MAADLQTPAAVAVVMPTVLRPTIVDAIRSVAAQDLAAPIQLLIGIDKPLGARETLAAALRELPAKCRALVLDIGYSTAARHGGLHPASDGGVLRTALTYLANARHVAYLDDDNWWAPNHLSSLLAAVAGRDWAWSLRRFVDPATRQPVCVDAWESVGPGRGIFATGWVDPNCLLIDKFACEPALRWWSLPDPAVARGMGADCNVFGVLATGHSHAGTGIASCFYAMNPGDPQHPARLARIAAAASAPEPAGPRPIPAP
jgi:hypothetical protein